MNKTYKVRATRTGALQVVSELTSSVAAIGTKTVVTVATTMVAGAAIAAIPAAPTEGEGNVINDKAITWDLVEADANQNFVYNAASTQESGDDFLTATEKKAFGKTMWVVAEEGEYATGIYAVGTGVTATNTGTIYVQGKVDAASSASSWQLHGMGAGNGATAVNVGTIEVENAYGMYVGDSDSTANETKPTIINNGTIRVYKQGVGMELGGVTKSTAENNGTIEVVSAEEVNKGTWAHGVLIKDQAEATFTNTGTITATAANTSAIEIQTDELSVKATVNLEGSSAIDGLIKISSKDASKVATVELNAKGVTDTFKLKADANSNVTLNILDGANVTLEDGQNSTIDVAKITNGTLTASIFQEDNAFKTVNLEEQGVFNITKLNSKTTAKATDNDRLLLAYDSTYNLNGGRLAVAGQTYTGDIRVGTNPTTGAPTKKGAGTLEVSAGSYTFADMSVRDTGKVNVTGGTLSVADLDVVRDGKVTVKGGALGVSGDLTLAKSGSLELQSGKLVTEGANVFTQAPDGKTWGASTVWGKVTKSGGVLEITDSITDLTLTQISEAQKLVDSSNMVQVSFVNATIKAGQELTGGNVGGLYLENETGTATDGSFSVSSSADTVLAAVDFGGKEPTATPGTVEIQTNDGALVLSGNDGNVFSGLNANTKTVNVTGSLVLGNDAEATGTVNVETLKVDNLTVVGTFTANNVTVDATAAVGADGTLTVNTLKGGATTVAGNLDVAEIAKDTTVQVADGGTVVLTKVDGTVEAAPSADFLSLTPEGVEDLADSKVYGTNENARDIIANSFMTDNDVKDKEVLFLDRVLEVQSNGQVNVGVASGTNGAVTVGSSGIVVIDANALGSTPLITGALNLTGATNGYLLNLNKTGNFEIASGAVTGTVTLADDNFFVSAEMGTLEGATDNKVYIKATFDKDAVGDQSDADMVALANAIESGMNADAKNGQVFKAIGDVYGDTETNVLTEAGQWAASEYVAAPVVAGTYNVAYDAAAEVTRAVMNHNAKGEGMGAWADVFYASNEAKKIYGGQGYSADVYGGVFGFDTVFSCGAKLGAALTIGQADADGERSFSKYSNDADFWGLSVYTGKNVADTSLYIGADLSYLWVDNDLKGTVAGASADESLDSTVFTVGLRADWTAYEGAFNVVPHAGVRYTAIDVDDYRGYASDSINVVELPVGVEVNGTFEASGWKVVPSVDFTIVPQVGDKDVKTAVGNVDVIDNLYNTTVGVEAVYGQYAFGLDAGYGFGSDDRQNATVKANFSYRF